MNYNTVIWDFGGVITSSPFEAFKRLEAEKGVPENSVRKINSANPDDNAWAKFERAELDSAGFDQAFADEAKAIGIELRGADVLAVLAGDVRPNMVATLDRLKSEGFTIACITNNVPAGKGAGMAMDDEKAAAVKAIMQRFDHIIESSKAGVRKPDPRIYQMMCEALGKQPSECIYLDDLGINCKPAAQLGMAAIKVSDEEQALGELSALLEMQLP
ncbi:MAG: HAD-IA family hydrolase [Parasphingorhabdus sp.]